MNEKLKAIFADHTNGGISDMITKIWDYDVGESHLVGHLSTYEFALDLAQSVEEGWIEVETAFEITRKFLTYQRAKNPK